MDKIEKDMLKSELMKVEAALLNASSMSSVVRSQMTFPVTGPIVTIPTFAMVSDAINKQSDAIKELVAFTKKIIDKM